MSTEGETFEFTIDQLSISAFFTLRERADDRLIVGLMLIPIIYGLIANLALIVTVARSKELIANPSYYLLIHIAACDLIILFFETFYRLAGIIFRQAYLGSAYSPLNYTIHFFRQCAWWSFVFELTLTAVNRFVCIFFVGRYDKLITHRSMLLAVLLTSALGVLMASPHLFPCCRAIWMFDAWVNAYFPYDSWYLQLDYVVILSTIGIILISYAGVCWRVRVGWRVKKSVASSKRSRQQLLIALQVGLMSGIYILNCLTWNIVPYLKTTRLTIGIYFSLNSIQCASHPTIAFLLNGRIRNALIRVTSKHSTSPPSTHQKVSMHLKVGDSFRLETRNGTDVPHTPVRSHQSTEVFQIAPVIA